MNMKVLITGGAGFIAHHVIDHILKTTDWHITTLDRLDESGNLNRLNDILKEHTPENRKRHRTVFHDLKAALNSQIRADIGDINIVLHLAAGSHVDRSITHPMEFVQDNVVGTVNLLNWAKELPNLKKFVYFSTDEIFGVAPPGVSYKEYDRYNSTNPYSASKAAAEEFCVAYENTYKMPIYITHTMNVFTAQDAAQAERDLKRQGMMIIKKEMGEGKSPDGVDAGAVDKHNCATHVYHEQWGEGQTIRTMHADPDEHGFVEWYDVMFDHGIEKGVPVAEMKVTLEMSHGNHKKKK